MTVLLTGGCGFIGANLVPFFVRRGYRVRVLDDLSSGQARYVHGSDIELIVGDIRDRTVVERAVRGCDGVIHLAAKTSVLESIRDPDTTFQVNVDATHYLLRIAAESGVRRFVFASSNAAVGDQELPIDELKVPHPNSPYGASKLAGEAYCSSYHSSTGLGTIALRFANAYGPFSGHKTSVVAKFIGRILDGRPITIYGDGKQTRDFIYVADVCDAIIRAIEIDAAGEVLQVATGVETSVLELVAELERVTGIEPRVEWAPQPPGEIRRSYASIDRARHVLGFEPRTSLRAGLPLTYRWLASQRAGVARHLVNGVSWT
jgi:UDP-glucose 4-epimerase